MSMEAAEEFLSACNEDPAIEKALLDLPKEKRDSYESVVAVAEDFGYKITVAELAQAFSKMSAASREAADDQELSVDELRQVAGGAKKNPECSSDYVHDMCGFDDYCIAAWNFYKQDPRCSTTFNNTYEYCTFDDRCAWGYNSYD